MGRKLNVALLLAMHLGFFACAGLIVGPLLTDGTDQGGDANIAVNQSKLGNEVTGDATTPKKVAEVQIQGAFSDQRNWLGQTFDQQLLNRLGQTDPQLREARRPYAQRRTP